MPRYRADVGIKDGKIAKIGYLKSHQAKKVIDAGGQDVVPGFVNLHTHYDAQLFWDPYCTISSWYGVTSVVLINDAYPERFREQLRWLESCKKRGIRVLGQGLMLEQSLTFTFKDWNLWDDSPAWRDCTVGSIEDRLMKLSDAQRRPELRAAVQSGVITNNIADIFVLKCREHDLKKYENLKVGEIAEMKHKHPVDAMLDIACADGLNAEF